MTKTKVILCGPGVGKTFLDTNFTNVYDFDKNTLDEGKDVFLEIEVQGALRVKEKDLNILVMRSSKDYPIELKRKTFFLNIKKIC